MELILLILKMASGYLLTTFLYERCTANRSRTMFTCSHGDVHVQMLLPLFEQLLSLYLPIRECTYISVFRVPMKIHVTLSEH